MGRDGGRVVLVVDDEPDVREMIELGLSLDGYRVITADGGDRALELIETVDIDLLITDFKMPGMSGVDIASCIRQVAPDLPVIVVTGYVTPSTLEACESLGRVEFIRKPFAFSILTLAVQSALGRE